MSFVLSPRVHFFISRVRCTYMRVLVYYYACTCFSKHAPPLVQLRHNDDDDSFASRSRDSPSLFRLSLRIVALVASLRCCSVSRFQYAFENFSPILCSNKKKKNLILPRVMRFFNRKFHTSNRETKRVSFEMYFRGTCEHASRSEKKDGNRYHEQFFFLFLFFLSFSRFKIYR